MQQNRVDRSLEIEQAQLRGFARSISEVEWLLLILVILYLFAIRPELAAELAVIGILVGFAAFVLAFRYTRLLAGVPRVKIAVEILAMLAFTTGVLGFSGGVDSPLVNLYLLPIITAALALDKPAASLVMAAVCLCYVLLGTLDGGLAALDAPFAAAAAGVLAPFILVAFSTILLAENIHQSKARIRALSDRDELTSLYNLRAFERFAEREHAQAARSGRPYTVLMIDIDALKSINDTYGHDAGNRAVKLVAEALERLTRTSDVVARYGGDEFVVLLHDAGKDVAEEVAQRIRNVVFSTTLEVDVKMVRIKVGVGAATYPDDGNGLQAVMAAADRAMYKDKHERERPKGRLLIKRL